MCDLWRYTTVSRHAARRDSGAGRRRARDARAIERGPGHRHQAVQRRQLLRSARRARGRLRRRGRRARRAVARDRRIASRAGRCRASIAGSRRSIGTATARTRRREPRSRDGPRDRAPRRARSPEQAVHARATSRAPPAALADRGVALRVFLLISPPFVPADEQDDVAAALARTRRSPAAPPSSRWCRRGPATARSRRWPRPAGFARPVSTTSSAASRWR